MRKNSRWSSSTQAFTARDATLARTLGLRQSGYSLDSSSSGRPKREFDLLEGFQELKRLVGDVENVDNLPLTTLLAPFFAIIRSPLSTGPITSSALSALHTFFLCDIITVDSPGLEEALADLSNTVSHCKFEASDSSGDEVVLLKIMAVIKECLCSGVGDIMGDLEVCEMLETVLTTCCQMRLSEILRRSAALTMILLVRTVFFRLHALDPVTAEEELARGDTVREETQTTPSKLLDGQPAIPSDPQENVESTSFNSPPGDQDKSGSVKVRRNRYGLPSVLELLRVLINILDPNDQLHTDSTRLTALGILSAAFEVSGPQIGEYPSLRSLIIDHGCKYLFQLARSSNPTVLQMSLRVISTMFDTMRKYFKLQQELFLAFTMDRLAFPVPGKVGLSAVQKSGFPASPRPGTPSPATPRLNDEEFAVEFNKDSIPPPKPLVSPARGETRELLLETLVIIARHPSFMVDLYVNYDCDTNCENIFERLLDFLTKGVRPAHQTGGLESQQQASQLLCLDLLLAFVDHMAARAEGMAETWPDNQIPTEELMAYKSRKRVVWTGASRFNTKPKAGLAYLEEHKLIYADADCAKPLSLAKFLKSCTRLDKRLLGDFLSREENLDVLKAFISLFDFKDKPIAHAMRELLESFRLPGEAGPIARITETFAEYYFGQGPAELRSQDATYVLAYSIIMLNTDQHNPQVRRRMTLEDYQKNVRGINEKADFSLAFIQNIYDSIRKQEIIMPEEHTGKLGFDYAWKELLARARLSGNLIMCNSAAFDVAMFQSVWRPVISAIAFAFITFDDDYIIQRAIAGFRQCATLAGHFRLPDVFDYVVVSLSQATGLLSDHIPSRIPNYPIVEVEGQTITVSSLSVKFGTNFKGQLAAVVLFTIVNGNGNALREGWMQIFEMFTNMFMHSLLPTRMLQMEDFLGGVSMIPLQGSVPAAGPATRGEGGLLSALSSYLMTPYGPSTSDIAVPDATDSEVESTLCTIDCITACKLDELYAQIMELDLEALVAAVRALEALAHERTVTRLKQESDDSGSISTGFSSPAESTYQLPYDPSSVFLLETMVSVTCHTPQHIDELWPIVFEHLSSVLSSANQYSVLLVERAVVGLLRLCLILAPKPALRDQVYVSLDILGSLPTTVVSAVAEQIMSGLVLVVKDHRDIISSQTEWNVVFALIRKSMGHPEAARLAFNMLMTLVSDGPDQTVTLDNYTGLVTVFDDFATAAGLVAENLLRKREHRGAPPVLSHDTVLDRGCLAVEQLFGLKKFLPSLTSSLTPSRGRETWRQLTLPLLVSLGRQSTNAAREVRNAAITNLQRILLGPDIIVDDDHASVEEIFNRVIFPLLDELLKPQVFTRDVQGMSETRLRASALLCKTFMHYEVRDARSNVDIRILWIQILDLLDRLMNINRRDQLFEAVPESLKNVLLVMNATDILVPPSPNDHRDERQRALWGATHERIERFLPGFLEEVIAVPKPKASSPVPDKEPEKTTPSSVLVLQII